MGLLAANEQPTSRRRCDVVQRFFVFSTVGSGQAIQWQAFATIRTPAGRRAMVRGCGSLPIRFGEPDLPAARRTREPDRNKPEHFVITGTVLLACRGQLGVGVDAFPAIRYRPRRMLAISARLVRMEWNSEGIRDRHNLLRDHRSRPAKPGARALRKLSQSPIGPVPD